MQNCLSAVTEQNFTGDGFMDLIGGLNKPFLKK